MDDVRLILGNAVEVLPTLESGSVDAVVTDPPYALGFMNQRWDSAGVAFSPETWAAALRVLKPGGYLLAFGGTRTYHRLTCAVEDGGFQVRDCLMWLYGQGFPKGRGCLKPAWEPIVLARKPGKGVAALSIGECRIPTAKGETISAGHADSIRAGRFQEHEGWDRPWKQDTEEHARRRDEAIDRANTLGRWPANLVLDEEAAVLLDEQAGPTSTTGKRSERSRDAAVSGTVWGPDNHRSTEYANEPPGGPSRFFYVAKASRRDRGEGNTHQTVKPTALMSWLVRLVTRPGETVLDPFAGSGTTGVACLQTGRRFVGVECDRGYHRIAQKRIAEARALQLSAVE